MSTPRKTYRVYYLDGVVHSVRVDEIEAERDEDVLAQVGGGDFGCKCEIWDGQRLVATLDGNPREA